MKRIAQVLLISVALGLTSAEAPDKEKPLRPDDPADIAAVRGINGVKVEFDRRNRALIRIKLVRPNVDVQSVIPLLQRLHNVTFFDARLVGTNDLLGCAENWPLLKGIDASVSGLVSDEGLHHLRGLTQLVYLRLRATSVGDAGLEEIASLNALVELNLRGTHVTDAGIRHLTALRHLERLDLADTRISDKGLESIGRLETLKDLSLSSTPISDAGIGKLAGLHNLESLDLGSTDITDAGVAKLKHLHELRNLYVYEALATEDVRNEFGRGKGLNIFGLRTKANLMSLDSPADVAALRDAGLLVETDHLRNVTRVDARRAGGSPSGWLPNLKNLHSLTILRLPRGTSDDDMIRVCELKSLQTLDVRHAGLTDSGTVNIGRLTELKELSFGYCRAVGDATAARLSPLAKLETLDLCFTGLTDAGLKQVGALRTLKTLRLDGEKVTDDGLAQLANLGSLVQLDLDRTGVTDKGLIHLAGLKKLLYLSIVNTATTNEGVDRLRKALPKLEVLPDYPDQ